MKEYLANYIGVVIQNNDPEMRGRIKVFVPNVSANLYENWDQDDTDKIFNFVDNPDLQKILNDLKKVLPWAEYAGPLFGGSASSRYNASLKKGVVSDTNSFDANEPVEGYRPLAMYTNELSYPDAFSATGKVGNKNVNPYAYQYIPSNYSNLAKGTFSIPNVGAHVWVWFMGGDPNFPVYFASAYGEEDFKRIYTTSQKTGLTGKNATSTDYPGSYENIESNELNSDSKTFRSKHVINTNKNSLEFVDTDGLEKIKFTHYSGSFSEINNQATIKFSTANDQTMVLGDVFETYQKNKSEYIGGVNDFIVNGDFYEKIGNQNSNSVEKIFEKYKSIHDVKTLFDVKRTKSNTSGDAFKFNVTSPFQDQEGSYSICPVCNSLPYIQGNWLLNPLHNRVLLPIPLPYPGFPGLDLFTPVPPIPIDINGQIGYIKGRECPLCNRNETIYSYNDDHIVGFSPSTVNGSWQPETRKLADGDLGDLYKSTCSEILDLQNNLGEGGDKINNISRNFVLNAGLVMNNLQSYRVDSRGKLKSKAVYLTPEGTIIQPEPTPHVEHVDVDPLPGGDIIITAGNKMKFLVGSNGINIKTFGPIEMYGSITNITSEQMNLLSKHELFIDGGEKLSLRGRHISLNPFEKNPVLVEGGLHVTGNSIVQGGMHVEGELGVQHVTAPGQWYQTEDGGGLTLLVNTLLPIGVVPPHVHPVIIQIPDHSHYYLNLPMDLKTAKEEARDAMVQLGINNNEPVKANPVLYPDPTTGATTLPFPIGGLSLGSLTEETLQGAGLSQELTDSIFTSLDEANQTDALDDLYQSFSTDSNDISNSVTDIVNEYQESVSQKVSEIEQSTENIFGVSNE